MTEQEAEDMTGYDARCMELHALIDMAHRLGLPLPDRLFVAEPAPDALAEAAFADARERCTGAVIFTPIADARRSGIEIRSGGSVYRWVHVNDAIVHAAAQPPERVPGNYATAASILREDADRWAGVFPQSSLYAAPEPGAVADALNAAVDAAVAAAAEHITETGHDDSAAAAEGDAAAADLPRPGGNENPTGTVHTGPGQPDLPGQPTVSEAEGAEPVNALPGEPDQTAVMEPLTEAIPAVTQDGES